MSTSANTYDSPHVDSFFSDMEGVTRGELHDTLKDSTNKYYTARSIEKDLILRNQHALSNVMEKDRNSLAKNNELSKESPPAAYNHAATAATSTTNAAVATVAGMQGTVVLPAGIPPATIAGNKDGIVLRDSVSLDEYHRKLEELTKTWPSVLSSGAVPNSYSGTHQPLHAVDRFPPVGIPVGSTSYGDTSTSWLSSFAQSKQGYAVREDQTEPASHDFRTMPIHTAPYHPLPPISTNVGVSARVAPYHG